MYHPIVEAFGLRYLLRVVRVEHHGYMEIAVADMADDRRGQKRACDVLLRFGDAFGQPRNRHADIGRPELRTLPQRLIGVDDVMAQRAKASGDPQAW